MRRAKLYILLYKYAFLQGWYEGKYSKTEERRDAQFAAAYYKLRKECRDALASF